VDTREKILETATRCLQPRLLQHLPLAGRQEAQVSKALLFWHFREQGRSSSGPLSSAPWSPTSSTCSTTWRASPRSIRSEADRRLLRVVSENIYSVKFVVSLILREEKHPDDVVGHMYELQRVYRNLLADIIDSGRQKGYSVRR